MSEAKARGCQKAPDAGKRRAAKESPFGKPDSFGKGFLNRRKRRKQSPRWLGPARRAGQPSRSEAKAAAFLQPPSLASVQNPSLPASADADDDLASLPYMAEIFALRACCGRGRPRSGQRASAPAAAPAIRKRRWFFHRLATLRPRPGKAQAWGGPPTARLHSANEYRWWRTCLGCKAANSKKLFPAPTQTGGIRHAVGCRFYSLASKDS